MINFRFQNLRVVLSLNIFLSLKRKRKIAFSVRVVSIFMEESCRFNFLSTDYFFYKIHKVF